MKLFHDLFIKKWQSSLSMKNIFVFLFLSLLEIVNAEIFNPEEINENDLVETNNLSSKDEDPFSSNLIGGEEKDQSNQDGSSNLIENDNSNENTGSFLSQAPEDGIETISTLSQDNSEKKEDQEQKASLFESSSKEKIGVPYWTKVVLNKKTQDVLVNVKTVTIIESLGGPTTSIDKTPESVSKTTDIGKTSSKSTTSKSSVSSKGTNTSKITSSSVSATPYIKIQMPTNKSSVSASASLSKISSTKKPESTSNSKSTSKSKSSQSKSVSSSVIKSSSVSKNDAFTKHASEDRYSTQSKTTSTDAGSSMGSIFDVLRNLPSGGNQSESVFVEGTFKFPKEKEMKKKVFKLSGYIASN